MDEREWGRRRSDNQPYPKTRGKDALPRDMAVLPGSSRMCRYRVPFTIVRDLVDGKETLTTHTFVRARTRSGAIDRARKLIKEKSPAAKLRISQAGVKIERLQRRRRKRTRMRQRIYLPIDPLAERYDSSEFIVTYKTQSGRTLTRRIRGEDAGHAAMSAKRTSRARGPIEIIDVEEVS